MKPDIGGVVHLLSVYVDLQTTLVLLRLREITYEIADDEANITLKICNNYFAGYSNRSAKIFTYN